MERDELRHEVSNLLQTVYVLTARLQHLLPPDASEARQVVEQLQERARQCRDRLQGRASLSPVPQLTDSQLPRLRVVVVEDDPVVQASLVEIIRNSCQHEVLCAVASGPEMVREVLARKPDLVVFDIHLPGIDGLAALREIAKDLAVAAVAITGDRNLQLMERALEDMILAYLLKPVDAHQISAAIQVAWARFKEFDALKSQNQSLQKNLQDRKVIEKAKGLLMKRNGWPEAQAFRMLQVTAMERRVAMVQVAQDVMGGQNLK